MAFKFYGSHEASASPAGGESDKPKVDYDELNKYVIETCRLQKKATIVGHVSVVCDLGVQDLGAAEVEFKGTPEEEAACIKEMPGTYFKDGKVWSTGGMVEARLKCWSTKPVQCVGIAIDFADIMLDLGQFFDDPGKPKPLRMWLGGTRWLADERKMLIGNPVPFRLTKLSGDWSLKETNLLHKMAVASNMINAGQAFKPELADSVLGKSFLFEAQVFWSKPGKEGRIYRNEKCRYMGALPKGLTPLDPVIKPLLISMNEPNDADRLKEIRGHVRNTLERSKTYEDSLLRMQLEPSGPVEKDKPTAPNPVVPAMEDTEEDVPF